MVCMSVSLTWYACVCHLRGMYACVTYHLYEWFVCVCLSLCVCMRSMCVCVHTVFNEATTAAKQEAAEQVATLKRQMSAFVSFFFFFFLSFFSFSFFSHKSELMGNVRDINRQCDSTGTILLLFLLSLLCPFSLPARSSTYASFVFSEISHCSLSLSLSLSLSQIGRAHV